VGLDGTGLGTQGGAGLCAAPAHPAPAHPAPAHPAPAHAASPHPASPHPAQAHPALPSQPGSERGTRARIARLILENGPVTAAGLSTRLNLTPAAVRRHLDNLLADGMIETRTARRPASRGRGRPAKLFAITDVGRSAFEHAYDDLAASALRFLAEAAGPDAVAKFARRQVADLEQRYGPVVRGAAEPDRVAALAEALSADGYAASASGAPCPTSTSTSKDPGTSTGASTPAGSSTGRGPDAGRGEQLCQHHCPVAHVAAEFPQLCEAETEAFARLLGTPVQRLATIANGDGICTTHITAPTLLNTRSTP
jgi:predicted ArsR family transcriptional regulator